MCISVSIFIDSSLNGSGSKNIKFSVMSDQEVNILLLRYQVMEEPFKAVDLGSSLAEMFNDDTECTYLTENERHLIENFRRLSDEKADALLNMSDVLNK